MKRQVDTKEPKKRRFGFTRNIVSELRKVAWPSRQEATRLTLIVLAVTIVIAVMLGVIDYAFSKFADAVLIK